MLQKFLTGALLLTILFVAQANAQPNALTLTPSLTIVQPITITKVTGKDLLFGKFAAYVDATGSVEITPAGARIFSGDITGVEGTFGAAVFTVSGLEGATFDLTLPSTATIQNTTQGSDDEMVVSNFTSSISGTPTIGQDGTLVFSVGATLTKEDATTRGIYAGTFTVTVNYQ